MFDPNSALGSVRQNNSYEIQNVTDSKESDTCETQESSNISNASACSLDNEQTTTNAQSDNAMGSIAIRDDGERLQINPVTYLNVISTGLGDD